MIDTTKNFIKSLLNGLVSCALVLGLSGVAGAKEVKNDDLQATLGIILDRLDDLEGKLDNLQTDVDNLPTGVDLRGVTQNWDKKLAADNGDAATGCDSARFTCLWPDGDNNPTAVRDNETGIVWERAPDMSFIFWVDAIAHCANREVGGRKGWSLPVREQLATLVDPSNSDPALPTGHPFLNVQLEFYWSASAQADFSNRAWGVYFTDGLVAPLGKVLAQRHAWCVRGGQAYDGPDVQEVIEALP